jgi:hypothetical protein
MGVSVGDPNAIDLDDHEDPTKGKISYINDLLRKGKIAGIIGISTGFYKGGMGINPPDA